MIKNVSMKICFFSQHGTEHSQSKIGMCNLEAKPERKEKEAKSLGKFEAKGPKSKHRPMCVNELPYSVLQTICQLLNIRQNGRDWMGVAGQCYSKP